MIEINDDMMDQNIDLLLIDNLIRKLVQFSCEIRLQMDQALMSASIDD